MDQAPPSAAVTPAPRIKRRPLWRWLLGALILLLLLAVAAGYGWWRRSLPQTEGLVRLNGLQNEVRVIRDSHGVPHIFAASLDDAWRALGYVHAQDRLFQMDLTRRVSQGRLAEIIGADGLPYDRLFRTLGLAERARRSLAALSPDARAALAAYADGVNAWLARRPALPLEYALLGFAPEPWRPEHAILWGKAMAWKLSANWRQEALRGKLAARHSRRRIETLFPSPLADWPVTLEPGRAPASSGAADTPPRHARATPRRTAHMLAQMLAWPALGAGASNEWVVAGSRSVTGMPLLANDPHLELSMPILWYLVRITTPELTLAGATAPGSPVVLLGQNHRIAWGFTTTDSDTQDLFVETLAPGDGGHYLTPEGSRPFATRTETIAVRGAAPVPITIRETRHGPVVSDVLGDALAGAAEQSAVIALAWTGFSDADATAEAFFRLNAAGSKDAFLNALRRYHAPTQNIVYADRDGTIGFVNAGAVPIRRSGDGRYPADGASGAHDWIGVIPFADWPALFDPGAGAILNANNAVVGDAYPHWLGRDFAPGFRARRIAELLDSRPRHDLDSFAAMQMDNVAGHASDLLPFLLRLEPQNPLQEQALAVLRRWDLVARHDRPEALILDWWLWRMNRRLIAGDLDDLTPTVGALNAAAILNVLTHPRGFCAADDCTPVIRRAFAETLAELADRYGDDVSRWRWGDEHRATMANQVMNGLPGFRALFGQSFASDGGFYAVNRGGNLGAREARHPLVKESGAGFRGLYDLADPSRSRFIIASGQSGHPLSPHYADQLPLWRRGKGLTLMQGGEAELRAAGGRVLMLVPE